MAPAPDPHLATPTAPPGIDAVLAPHVGVPGGLLPALHAVQHHFGWIDPTGFATIAWAFGLSVAEVHGVVSFYKDFRTSPPSGPLVQVCRAEACQARGGEAVHAAVATAVASEAMAVDLEDVYCLGLCASGPAAVVGGRRHTRLDAAIALALVRSAAADDPQPRSQPIPDAAASDGTPSPRSGGRETVTVYVPRDAVARAAGADAIAALLAARSDVRVVRNGSRGLLWLEPLVEVVTAEGRIAYGPVAPSDVDGLLAAGVLQGAAHPLRLGRIDEHEWLARQQRVTFARVGLIDPLSAPDYAAHGGLTGLRRALAMEPAAVVAEVTASGLRGRGGAAFPTGVKWQTVLETASATKYVVANGDEGDSGTYADRMLLEGDPLALLEGMAICGWAVGAHDGYVYVRSEYPDAIETLRAAVAVAEQDGWLGRDVLGSGFAFRVHVSVGAGAYICGEETALLESLEGRRGVVRAKPPLPAHHGLFGQPTVVNNLLTLATVPAVLADGAAAYAALGTGRSRGTQVFQLAGNVARGGIVETAFGVGLGELVADFGGGTANGRPVRAVQVGGPLGAYLPTDRFALPMDYETFAAADAMVGHGGVVVFDDLVDLAAQARFAMAFCAAESCGKCTPCRIGSTRGVELIDRITAASDPSAREADLATLSDLCEVMADASLCAMGGLTPLPVRSALTHFGEDFRKGRSAAASVALTNEEAPR